MNLQELKEALFTRGAAMGFTDMEVYYQSNREVNIKVFKGEIDTYSIATDGGLAFRGRYAGKMGYGYTELIDLSALDGLLEGAKASAQAIDSEETEPLYEGPFAYETAHLYHETVEQITPEALISFLQEVEAECFRLDSRVTLVPYCMAEIFSFERMIANTTGLNQSEKGNLGALILNAVVRQENDTKSSFKFWLMPTLESLDPKAAAKEVVAEALSFLGAEPAVSGNYPVLLRHTAAANLLGSFASVFFASNVQKGRSLLKGRVGEQIASPILTLVDDPFRPLGLASRSFDSEGVPSRRLNLVENGQLTTLLHNLKSAEVDGVASTGHGHKTSYKGAVAIAPSNLYVQPGTPSLEEMVAEVEEGVLITDLQGLHSGANPVSGDFSLAANGYLIKSGKIDRPVNQITVAGNFFTLLQEIEVVGSDLAFRPPMGGYVGSPSLRIKSLAVTGK